MKIYCKFDYFYGKEIEKEEKCKKKKERFTTKKYKYRVVFMYQENQRKKVCEESFNPIPKEENMSRKTFYFRHTFPEARKLPTCIITDNN